jgi:hypothetical protein
MRTHLRISCVESVYLQALVGLFIIGNGFRKYQEAKKLPAAMPAANLLFATTEQNSASSRIEIVCAPGSRFHNYWCTRDHPPTKPRSVKRM